MMSRKIKASSNDARSIDMEDEYAVDFWTRELSVTETKLKAAVKLVGTSVIDVRRELKK
jgi:hypothetical protein